MQTDLTAVDAQVRDLVVRRTQLSADDVPTLDETPLGELGIDSIAILSLVVGVEERFGVEVADGDVVPDNFGSVAAISRYVARRLER